MNNSFGFGGTNATLVLSASRAERVALRVAMQCPFCRHLESQVVDSRLVAGGTVTWRRRECEACTRRFTTYERVEDMLPSVVKKDGRREPFDRQKLLRRPAHRLQQAPGVRWTRSRQRPMRSSASSPRAASARSRRWSSGERVMTAPQAPGRSRLRALRERLPVVPRHRRVHARDDRARASPEPGVTGEPMPRHTTPS